MVRVLFLTLTMLTVSTAVAQSQTIQDKSSDWVSLFDGKSTAGWRDFRGHSFSRNDSWKVEDGCLVSLSKPGDIVTTRKFGDFELEFQWKVTSGANSGVFFRLSEDVTLLHHSALEYQVLDNIGQAGRPITEQAGACYGVYGSEKDHTKPVGQWNSARIVAQGKHIEYFLNGQKLFAFDIGSEDWNRRLQAGPLRNHKALAQAKRGHISLQNYHGHQAYFRSIRIRELNSKPDADD